MKSFDSFRELTNGKKYDTAIYISMSENFESSPIMNAPERNTDEKLEERILSQEDVNEQIRSYFAPLTKQLENWNRLIQGVSTVQQPNTHPRVGTSASFSAAGCQPDTSRQK